MKTLSLVIGRVRVLKNLQKRKEKYISILKGRGETQKIINFCGKQTVFHLALTPPLSFSLRALPLLLHFIHIFSVALTCTAYYNYSRTLCTKC
jgi:hypothetical protein